MDSFLAYPAIVFKSGGHQSVSRTHYDTADELQQHNPQTHLNYVTSIKSIVDIDFYTGMLPYYHSKPKVGEYITYRQQ